MWEQLVGVLANMLTLYQELLAISKQKNAVLVKARTQELETLTKQEELLIIRIGKLDHAREKLLQEITAANRLPGEALPMSRLVALAEADIAEQLNELWRQLSSITAEMAKVNEVNTKLIDQALFFINYNINLLTQSATSPTYAAQGQQGQAAPARKVIDRKV